MSWVFFVYVSVQLPFALLSAAGLAVAAFVYSAIGTLSEAEGVSGFFVRAGVQGAEAIADFFGTNLYELTLLVADTVVGIGFDPLILFVVPFAFLFAVGLLQLLLVWFVYSLFGLNSLSGTSVGPKWAAFLTAAVGICVPILNLFPLILIWTTIVWLRPK